MTFAIITVLVCFGAPMAGVFAVTLAEERARKEELTDDQQ